MLGLCLSGPVSVFASLSACHAVPTIRYKQGMQATAGGEGGCTGGIGCDGGVGSEGGTNRCCIFADDPEGSKTCA